MLTSADTNFQANNLHKKNPNVGTMQKTAGKIAAIFGILVYFMRFRFLSV